MIFQFLLIVVGAATQEIKKDLIGILLWVTIALLVIASASNFCWRVNEDRRLGIPAYSRLSLLYFSITAQFTLLLLVGITSFTWQFIPIPALIMVAIKILLVVAGTTTLALPVSAVMMNSHELGRIQHFIKLLGRS